MLKKPTKQSSGPDSLCFRLIGRIAEHINVCSFPTDWINPSLHFFFQFCWKQLIVEYHFYYINNNASEELSNSTNLDRGPSTCNTYKNRVRDLFLILSGSDSLSRSLMVLRNLSSTPSERRLPRRFNGLLGWQPACCCVSRWTLALPNVHFIKEEIWDTILLMPSGKAPGLDRFSLNFYKVLA